MQYICRVGSTRPPGWTQPIVAAALSGTQRSSLRINATDHGKQFAGARLQVSLIDSVLKGSRPGAGSLAQEACGIWRRRSSICLESRMTRLSAGRHSVDLVRRYRWCGAGSALGAAVLSEVRRSLGQPKWFPSSKGDMPPIVSKGYRHIRSADGRDEDAATVMYSGWRQADCRRSQDTILTKITSVSSDLAMRVCRATAWVF